MWHKVTKKNKKQHFCWTIKHHQKITPLGIPMVFPACPWGVAQQPISRKRWPDPQSAAAMTIHHHPWPMMMFSDVQWGLHQWLNWFNHQWYNDGDLNGVIHNFIIFHMCPVTPVIYIGFMRIFEHQWIKKGLSKEMPMPQCSRMCFTYDACLPITSRCPTVQKKWASHDFWSQDNGETTWCRKIWKILTQELQNLRRRLSPTDGRNTETPIGLWNPGLESLTLYLFIQCEAAKIAKLVYKPQ